MGQRTQRRARRVERLALGASDQTDGLADALRPARPVGPSISGVLERRHLGIGVEQRRHEGGRRERVRRGMVELHDHRDTSIRKSREHMELPQRPTAIQPGAHDPCDGVRQLFSTPGRRDLTGDDVLFQRHRTVDELRMLEAEGRCAQTPAQGGHSLDPAAHQIHHPIAGQRPAGAVSVRDPEGAVVAEHVAGLAGQELGIEGGQPS